MKPAITTLHAYLTQMPEPHFDSSLEDFAKEQGLERYEEAAQVWCEENINSDLDLYDLPDEQRICLVTNIAADDWYGKYEADYIDDCKALSYSEGYSEYCYDRDHPEELCW